MAQSSNSSRQGRPAQTSYDSNAIPKSTSAQCRPVTVKRAHQRPFNTTHSANLGHGTSSWADSSSGTPKANKNRPSSIQAYEPNVYISKFMNDLEPTGAAAKRQRVGGFDGSSQPTIDASLAYSTFVPAQAPTMSPCTNQYAQRTDRSYGQAQDVERPCQAQDMERTWSQQSDWSTSSAASTDLKATERRRKHIENGRQTIAPKSIPGGPKSTSTQLRTDDSLNPHHHIDPSIRRKEAISKTPYVRPHHPKLYCTLCQDHPTGFRGEHELRRHQDRAHADSRKVWICVEPTTESEEGWRPQKPLGICKQCKQRKEYNVCYNAAAHLRRAHFCPRKRGRKAKGEERESRGGKAGGHWPPIEWLKASGWLQEVETTSAHLFTQDATLSKLDTSFIDDFLDEEDNFEFAPDSAIDFQRAAFAAENLGLQMYPTYTDWTSGYPTPRLDSAPRAFFPAIDTKANVLHAPIDTDCFEAPAMAYTLSAPPAMQSAPLMFDVDSELAAHNAIGLLYQEDVQMSIPFM
ncbi:hypothetical protein LTR02_002945 [Friedmanniomyces endolithicus]|nr:hypothetical protein LTR02_002945 [Friedmanniomyces endolithicus]